MPSIQNATQCLDQDFLEIRSRILDVAAALDRIDVAVDASSIHADQRMAKLHEAISVLIADDADGDRACRVQMVFSDAYTANWRG